MSGKSVNSDDFIVWITLNDWWKPTHVSDTYPSCI